VVPVIVTMFVVGLILGFIGAGGSGFIISILTVGFGFSIHTVLGTALLAMLLSSLSGAVSHYREGNMNLTTGTAVGAAGALGAFACSKVSNFIPSSELTWMTAVMLIVSGLALWLRMGIVSRRKKAEAGEAAGAQAGSGEGADAGEGAQEVSAIGIKPERITLKHPTFWIKALGIGIVTGCLSGLFGIGSTPFIQIGLMAVLGMPVRIAAGTTMLVIIPIALGGGLGYYSLGHVDLGLLIQVSVSVMLGSYIGAKFTKRVPSPVLQTAMVVFPMIGGAILLV
jgi:uncharacterized membrane protein YfcA